MPSLFFNKAGVESPLYCCPQTKHYITLHCIGRATSLPSCLRTCSANRQWLNSPCSLKAASIVKVLLTSPFHPTEPPRYNLTSGTHNRNDVLHEQVDLAVLVTMPKFELFAEKLGVYFIGAPTQPNGQQWAPSQLPHLPEMVCYLTLYNITVTLCNVILHW